MFRLFGQEVLGACNLYQAAWRGAAPGPDRPWTELQSHYDEIRMWRKLE